MIGRQMDPATFADAVIDEFNELLLAAAGAPDCDERGPA